MIWRSNLHPWTPLADLQKVLEAHGCKLWVANLLIVPPYTRVFFKGGGAFTSPRPTLTPLWGMECHPPPPAHVERATCTCMPPTTKLHIREYKITVYTANIEWVVMSWGYEWKKPI